MTTVTKQDIIDAISQMTVLDLSELVKEMETKFGVSAASVAAAAPATGAATAAAEEQTEFSVILTEAGANKVAAIKVVREITGLGLGEAKAVVEAAPKAVKEAVSKADAEAILKKIVDAGAKGEIK